MFSCFCLVGSEAVAVPGDGENDDAPIFVKSSDGELRLGMGIRVGRKRVERLMRLAGITGVYRRKANGRRPKRVGEVSADLVDRQFDTDGPDRLWMADITEHPTREGTVYLAVVLDAWNREVIGWSIADHLRAEIVCDAFEMARWKRRPQPGTGLVHHSDHGGQTRFKGSSQRCLVGGSVGGR